MVCSAQVVFTFHNVSISTVILNHNVNTVLNFTFHNVSISTCAVWLAWKESFLYIPQCIYFYEQR